MSRLFANNAATTLAANLAASPAAQTVTIANGNAFPAISGADTFFVTLEKIPTTGVVEILQVTAHSAGGSTLTVDRGQDGTAVAAWLAGDLVEMRVVAKEYDEFVAETDANVNLQGNLTVAGTVSFTGSGTPVASGGTGLTSLTAGAVLIGSGTAPVSFIEPGAAGDVLATTDGANWASVPIGTVVTRAVIASDLAADPITVAEGGTGLQALTDGALMVGNGTDDVAFIPPGATGDVLQVVGGAWTPVAFDTNIQPRGLQKFTSSGVFEVPAGVTKVWLTGHGGGGGGAYLSSGLQSAPGARGGFVYRQEVAVTPGDFHAVTIGIGGAAASIGGGGSAGSATTLAALLSIPGGAAGGGTLPANAPLPTNPTIGVFASSYGPTANSGSGGKGGYYISAISVLNVAPTAGGSGFLWIEWGLES